jgi:predicted HD superfamily hydrolase involved in NAD metabolism
MGLRADLAAEVPVGAAIPAPLLSEIARRGLYGGRWRRWLKSRLSPGRYAHSLAVSRLAAELARRNGLDVWKAAAAGLLHDAGRSLPLRRMAAYARERRLKVPQRRRVEEKAPLLLHAHVGADLARRRLGVEDPEILRAIERHTLGHPDMSGLDEVLYVADACSEDRSYPGAARLRALARKDLKQALLAAAENKLQWVRKSGEWLHPSGPALVQALRKRR